MNIWPILQSDADTKPPRDTFFYYRGLTLEAVRQGDWKLCLAAQRPKTPQDNAKLYNLGVDIGETTDVAAAHPGVVETLQTLVAEMANDLGLDGIPPGCRALGRVTNAQPLISHDGKVRQGFAPATP